MKLEGAEWINLAQDMDSFKSLANLAANFKFPLNEGNALPGRRTDSCGSKILVMGPPDRPFSVRSVGSRRSAPCLMVIGLSCGCCNFYIAENTSQRLRRNSDNNSQFLDINFRSAQTNCFEMSGVVTICLPACGLVAGLSGRQASEQVALGHDDL